MVFAYFILSSIVSSQRFECSLLQVASCQSFNFSHEININLFTEECIRKKSNQIYVILTATKSLITSFSCINLHLGLLIVQWSLKMKDTLVARLLPFIRRQSSGGRIKTLQHNFNWYHSHAVSFIIDVVLWWDGPLLEALYTVQWTLVKANSVTMKFLLV